MKGLDPRTPVLVGAGAISERSDDPRKAGDAVELMLRATELAGADSGRPELLSRAGLVVVPQGTWRFKDAGRRIAGHYKANGARTVFARIGVLQTTLFAVAAGAISRGDVDVALVVGGEAKWRETMAARAGIVLETPDETGSDPDETLVPEHEIVSREEISAGLVAPVSQYALMENARRYADGTSPEENARQVAELWSRFSEVAASNPLAWDPRRLSPDEIRLPGKGNRPLALPYNKLHVSQWNVDQSAAFVLCSASAARSAGVDPELWVFPHAIAESNHMTPVSRRLEMHRSPGFAKAGERAFARSETSVEDVAHIDLYSCFPIAVRTQARELGLSNDRDLTVTGGMTFGGGPLNNYALQSTAAMTGVLRSDPGSSGLVTAVSGMITKQGVSIWGSSPPKAGYGFADVSDEVGEATPLAEVRGASPGDATVASYTVLYGPAEPEKPDRAVVIADVADGVRSIVTSTDPALVADMTVGEWCGRKVRLKSDGTFSPY